MDIRMCPHKQAIAFEDWQYESRRLTNSLLKGEAVSSVAFFAWPFRLACADCQYTVYSQGPESLKMEYEERVKSKSVVTETHP